MLVIKLNTDNEILEKALKELYFEYQYYAVEYTKNGGERYKNKANEALNKIIKLKSKIK